MDISLRQVATALIFVFTTALFVLFILFDTYTWGKYAFIGLFDMYIHAWLWNKQWKNRDPIYTVYYI